MKLHYFSKILNSSNKMSPHKSSEEQNVLEHYAKTQTLSTPDTCFNGKGVLTPGTTMQSKLKCVEITNNCWILFNICATLQITNIFFSQCTLWSRKMLRTATQQRPRRQNEQYNLYWPVLMLKRVNPSWQNINKKLHPL